MGKPVLCMSPKETAVGDGQPVVLYGGGPQPGFPTASAALKPPTQGHCRRGRGTIRSGCCLAVRAALPARVDDLSAKDISFFLLFLEG